MKRRQLGRTGLSVSEIGFGTCQLRMTTFERGVDTLVSGFERGVNIIHAAADYAGAFEVVEEALRRTEAEVLVCTNGWGQPDQFEALFEDSLERFGHKGPDGRQQLGLYGIASVEDRELLGEDVWGESGLVEFLRRQKRKGRLQHSFFTSHGSPDYIRKLIDSDAFDAAMFAYNALGIHALSFNAPDDRGRESINGNAALIDYAASRNLGVMLMEVLAGGLLVDSRAFAGASEVDPVGRTERPSAGDILADLLHGHPDVSCLLPGTASVKEAIENAAASDLPARQTRRRAIEVEVAVLKTEACLRCGVCETLCSQNLEISWLFRSADIAERGASPFETPDDKRYFDLHDATDGAACDACPDMTCRCPVGIDIPEQLSARHRRMMVRLANGDEPATSPSVIEPVVPLDARLLSRSWNGSFAVAAVKNVGINGWPATGNGVGPHLQYRVGGKVVARSDLRVPITVGEIAYFPFDLDRQDQAEDGDLWIVFEVDDVTLHLGSLQGPHEGGGNVATIDLLSPTAIAQTPVVGHEDAVLGPRHAVTYGRHGVPCLLNAGMEHQTWLEITNTGCSAWNVDEVDVQTDLVVALGDWRQTYRLSLVQPGEIVIVDFGIMAPITEGLLTLTIDLVRQGEAYLSKLGSSPFEIPVRVAGESEIEDVGTLNEPVTYGVEVIESRIPAAVGARSRFGMWCRIRNNGSMRWDDHAEAGQMVGFAACLDEEVLASVPLPHPVEPGTMVDLHIVTPAPDKPGRHRFTFGLVHQGKAMFRDLGVAPLEAQIMVRPGQVAGADLYEVALRSNSAFYHPGGGVSRLSDGTFLPQILERASGCYVWDTDGRRYIDYTMGWGSALLGHGEPRVEAAVRRVIGGGQTLPLPHRIELELTRHLCEQADIPCAEAVAFGKNGSDVCTLAVRLARLATGRRTVLICGYHGWQDWFAEPLGFAGTGVPDRERPLVVRVAYNDVEGLRTAVREHRADLAAIMMEPAGAAGGSAMVGEDADPTFLTTALQEARAAGALLIFDEIITGFRYPGGSVQKAMGVTPDLACFGKAIANGHPLAALVGRRDIMDLMSRAFYGPTFKGEVYALAAARAALGIYATEPVAQAVWEFGRRLHNGMSELCRKSGLEARVAGPPFRMGLHFTTTDARRADLLRTLFIQETLRGGLITHSGVMLPSLAHREGDLDHTLTVVESALSRIKTCVDGGNLALHRAIEIPLVKF